MKIRCDYCGSTYEDTLDRCPNCGAPNIAKWDGDNHPKTIEELKIWYKEKGFLPSHITRFFIGENISEPRAFYIYRDESGDFVVCKNKNDGTRVVRYKGKDEEYAVNLLWERLKEEVLNQKLANRNSATKYNRGLRKNTKSSFYIRLFIFLLFASLLIFGIARGIGKFNSGYLKPGNTGYTQSTYSYHWSPSYGYDTTSSSSSNLSWLDDSTDWNSNSSWLNDDSTDRGTNSSTSGDNSSWFSSTDWDSDSWSSSSWDSNFSWDSSDSWDSSSVNWNSDW